MVLANLPWSRDGGLRCAPPSVVSHHQPPLMKVSITFMAALRNEAEQQKSSVPQPGYGQSSPEECGIIKEGAGMKASLLCVCLQKHVLLNGFGFKWVEISL